MPSSNPSNAPNPSPAPGAPGSPEFDRAVAEAVAVAMAAERAKAASELIITEQVSIAQAPVTIQRTSIDTTTAGPDDLTIRFTRFCTMANCGYQRGQEAGFPRHLAVRAVASGSAILVHDPRLHDPRFRRAA